MENYNEQIAWISLNGCEEESSSIATTRRVTLESQSIDYKLLGAEDLGSGAFLREDDSDFIEYVEDRAGFFTKRVERLSPKTIMGWKDWNQKSNGSCTSMGATHAAQSSNGYSFLYGVPLEVMNFNPLFLYMRGKNFRYSDGENIWTFAKNMVEIGNSPVKYAGGDCVNRKITRSMWEDTNAGMFQSTICELSTIENVVKFLQAGFGIMFGSRYIPTAIDQSGAITKSTSGAHCMSLIGWDYKKEMPYFQNSWGDVYNGQSGGFIKSSYLEKFDMFGKFGKPIAVLSTEYRMIGKNSK